MLSVRRAGVEPANPQGMAGLRPVGLANAQSSHVLQVAQAGVEPAVTKVLAWPLCGFAYRAMFVESALDGIWTRDLLRDRQASTPGCSTRACSCSSGSGGSRTHSIPGSKPRWSAGCLPSRSGPGWSRTIVSWVWTKSRCRWTTGPCFSSGVTGSRTRISSMPCWRLPVGP